MYVVMNKNLFFFYCISSSASGCLGRIKRNWNVPHPWIKSTYIEVNVWAPRYGYLANC